MSVVSYDSFAPETIRFGPVSKNSYGGSYVPFQTPTGGNLYLKIMTPPMVVPFGVSTSKFDADNYYIEPSFRGEDPEVLKFHESMKAFDQHLLEAAVANAAEWFPKKKLPDDPVLKASILDSPDCHKTIVKPPRDPKWGDKLVTKARITPDGGIDCKFFDADRNPVAKDDVPQKCTMRLVIEASNVFLSTTGWGVTWRVRQAQIIGGVDAMQPLADCAFTVVTAGGGGSLDGGSLDDVGAGAFV
jgi:hypothetical protein